MSPTVTADNCLTVLSEVIGEHRIAKFDDAMVISLQAYVGPAVRAYIESYDGDFEYLQSVKAQVAGKGRMSVAQARGIANCMAAQIKRNQAATAPTGPSTWAPIADGTYSVVRTDDSYTTIKFRSMDDEHLAKFNRPEGTQIASYLMGQDNESSYLGFAFVTPEGRPQVWKKYKEAANLVDAINGLLTTDEETRKAAGLQYALISGNCCKCGRTLTVPASIHMGMGPICAAKS